MSSLEDFFKTMPPVTRALLVATFSVTIGVVTHVISLDSIFLNWELVLSKFQIWRVLSEFFYIGPFSISWLFHMYFFVQYASKLEKHSCFTYPAAQSGSFLYFIILQMLFLNSLSLLFFSSYRTPSLALPLHFAVIYYWSKMEAFQQVFLWGFQLSAWQLPYALLVLNFLLGQSIMQDLLGLFSGHMYYFLRNVLPAENNIHILKTTPHFLNKLADSMDIFKLNRHSSNFPSFSNPPPSGTQSRASGVATLFHGTPHSSNHHAFPGKGLSVRDSIGVESSK
ncbi:uncharacterized protein LOC128883955 [Hylaeus volcanicus]|uniref:uncharacterized protein LOC128883955 n=1 Tax=Hylaeus volcanicus TaxID=313075 RepID=UPI0023B7BC9A|nr:uncharacterized protein LOC128883955 [Hylaeus volcanicus]XP_053992833.1 uncharacterized protein LOC128883955 [Hylaeus volcanicus]